MDIIARHAPRGEAVAGEWHEWVKEKPPVGAFVEAEFEFKGKVVIDVGVSSSVNGIETARHFLMYDSMKRWRYATLPPAAPSASSASSVPAGETWTLLKRDGGSLVAVSDAAKLSKLYEVVGTCTVVIHEPPEPELIDIDDLRSLAEESPRSDLAKPLLAAVAEIERLRGKAVGT